MEKFKIRCSAISRIMAGSIGLTETQEAKLQDYLSRQNGTHPKGLKLTANMVDEMLFLTNLKNNPQLPEGAKTYCKDWLKETLYKRKEDIKSKFIAKGHSTEEEGFSMVCLHVIKGMAYKNEEFREDEYMKGTCDIDHEASDTVYDNKSSWSLAQFPMFETECLKKDYLDQVKGYAHLWKRGNGAVVYTLNDIPIDELEKEMKPWLSEDEKQNVAINLLYTQNAWLEAKARFFPNAKEVQFVEIPEEKRVKVFKVAADPAFIADVQTRVKMCRQYIDSLLNK